MVVRLQLRHDTKHNWEQYDPVLAAGELGIETDNVEETNRIKIGDGVHKWSELLFMDETSVHKFANEIIYGEKSFESPLHLDQGGTISDGYVLAGVVTHAIRDEKGNVIEETYQKILEKAEEVEYGTDWNEITAEGIYKINLGAWNYVSYTHTPNEFDENIDTHGLLIVHVNDNYVSQYYYCVGNFPILTRIYNGSEWSIWNTVTAKDTTVVHTTGAETIKGNKTFEHNVILTAGSVNYDRVDDATVLKQGTPFIRKSSSGDLVLSADMGGVIYLRPNGDNENNGSVTIDSEGIIQGKVTKDSAGNTITETYARLDQMANIASNEGVTAIILGRQMLSNNQGYQEVLAMKNETAVGNYIDVIRDGLEIPYTLTKAGTKIVDIQYKDRVDECYDEFSTANYFILDEDQQQYMLPYDAPDGHCVMLVRERNGISYYEYDTNLECTQTGACTANTPVIFTKPFADDQYALSCPYSAKSATGFTPTQTGDFIARGRITLG